MVDIPLFLDLGRQYLQAVLLFGLFLLFFGPDPAFKQIGPDLHQDVRIWLKMEERMIKIGLFEYALNDALNKL